ncbi:hypothetical protein BDZ97DRAFT_696106 [Flammula alnicola]|nr:hypothetical protein BDZ97DRAFT_696106 [Flammula alnicola]
MARAIVRHSVLSSQLPKTTSNNFLWVGQTRSVTKSLTLRPSKLVIMRNVLVICPSSMRDLEQSPGFGRIIDLITRRLFQNMSFVNDITIPTMLEPCLIANSSQLETAEPGALISTSLQARTLQTTSLVESRLYLSPRNFHLCRTATDTSSI